ncbi:MAG: solute:sodium symporter family transporter [Victivallaceae bacterium]|nr:solute:sodium symporter family transporter [Victivallaceae bacterium]
MYFGWLFGSFVFWTAFVALATWYIVRRDDASTVAGLFLAGRKLTFPVIAGSLLLTDISAIELVGLNGDAFDYGLSVMCWEVMCVFVLVIFALFLLPRYLKSGITTIPELMELRFDRTTRVCCNLLLLFAYIFVFLPIVLYSGAQAINQIVDMKSLTGFSSDAAVLSFTVVVIGIIGALYAIKGGLKSVAVSDTLNGILLLGAGLLIPFLALKYVDADIFTALTTIRAEIPAHFNSIAGNDNPTPFPTLFCGVFLIHLFYWGGYQHIIQRTFAAKNLRHGQGGALMCAGLKILSPCYLVLPGIIAYYLFEHRGLQPGLKQIQAYGSLVRLVLPSWMTGFFAAAVLGAVLSTFNSVLNSCCTLFGVDLYRGIFRPNASDREVVRASSIFGWLIALGAILSAPLLAKYPSIFTYAKQMDGIYCIPLLALILTGLFNKKAPAVAAKTALALGLGSIVFEYFVAPHFGFSLAQKCGHLYYFLAIVFWAMVFLIWIWGIVSPRKEGAWIQRDAHAVDLRQWKYTVPAAAIMVAIVFALYFIFADFSVLAE